MTKNTYTYKTPKGFKRAYTITGRQGVARLLFRKSDNQAFGHIIFWPKKQHEQAKSLFIPMSRVNFQAMKVGQFRDQPNYAEALGKTVHGKHGGIRLLPRPAKTLATQLPSYLETASGQSEICDFDPAGNCEPENPS